MRGIIMLVTLAGRRLAADSVPFVGLRYPRVLMLSATLTAAMVVGLLAYAPSARADVACDVPPSVVCLEKTATPDPVTVGEPLTFTITQQCLVEGSCTLVSVISDTLPEGLEFRSASATGAEISGVPPPTCSESAGTVTCRNVSTFVDTRTGIDVPGVVTIEVIPTECGTFTNTALISGLVSVSETFTVVGCGPTVPTTKEQCKKGGWKDLGWPDQGSCITAFNENRP